MAVYLSYFLLSVVFVCYAKILQLMFFSRYMKFHIDRVYEERLNNLHNKEWKSAVNIPYPNVDISYRNFVRTVPLDYRFSKMIDYTEEL